MNKRDRITRKKNGLLVFSTRLDALCRTPEATKQEKRELHLKDFQRRQSVRFGIGLTEGFMTIKQLSFIPYSSAILGFNW
jgi:hypothetical protein